MKVYVAASSQDMERARLWMERLGDFGVDVTSNWVNTIQAVGIANPREATNWQRRNWSHEDLVGVDEADMLWFLVPEKANGRGAYFEAGYALGVGKHLVFSGDTRQSIFCGLGKEFMTDDDAFNSIIDTHNAVACWEGL